MVDDYEVSHGEWLDLSQNHPLPIDDDFVDAKGFMVGRDEAVPVKGASRGAPKREIRPTGSALTGINGPGVSDSRSAVDELPHIDWSGFENAKDSLEVSDDSPGCRCR